MRKRRTKNQEADLDITSFMNLMIILVPVLLMTMVLSRITVLDLVLPDLSAESADPAKQEKLILEVEIRPDVMVVNLIQSNKNQKTVAAVPKIETAEGEFDYDYVSLQLNLKNIKAQLKEKGIDKKDILILSQPDTDYQTIVRTMDTVRSFKAVQAASVVDAALFPAVSLGDAPPLISKGGN